MNRFTVKKMSENNVIELCNWKYGKPYDIYNLPPYGEMVKQNWGIADPEKREGEFYSVYDNDEFVGYFRFCKQDGHIMLGLGLIPDLCGRGIGKDFFEVILEEYNREFANKKLFLEVRTFNERAIKLYKKVGFKEIKKYFKETPGGIAEMLLMEY